MSTTLTNDARPVSSTLTELLAVFDVERTDGPVELAIDRFDQWTNPPGAVLASTCTLAGAERELQRAV